MNYYTYDNVCKCTPILQLSFYHLIYWQRVPSKYSKKYSQSNLKASTLFKVKRKLKVNFGVSRMCKLLTRDEYTERTYWPLYPAHSAKTGACHNLSYWNKNKEMVMDRVYRVRNPLNDKQYCQQSHLYLCINTRPKSGGPARLKKEAPQTESINSVN